MSRIIVLAGLSGSGKSTALNVFEDLGYAVMQDYRLSWGVLACVGRT